MLPTFGRAAAGPAALRGGKARYLVQKSGALMRRRYRTVLILRSEGETQPGAEREPVDAAIFQVPHVSTISENAETGREAIFKTRTQVREPFVPRTSNDVTILTEQAVELAATAA